MAGSSLCKALCRGEGKPFFYHIRPHKEREFVLACICGSFQRRGDHSPKLHDKALRIAHILKLPSKAFQFHDHIQISSGQFSHTGKVHIPPSIFQGTDDDMADSSNTSSGT